MRAVYGYIFRYNGTAGWLTGPRPNTPEGCWEEDTEQGIFKWSQIHLEIPDDTPREKRSATILGDPRVAPVHATVLAFNEASGMARLDRLF